MKNGQHLVVIPAHNEMENIYEVVTRSLMYADVSVTDDGSRDQTPEILRKIQRECHQGCHRHELHVITHPQATHIPKSIQDGLRYGVERGYSFIITMDAGLSHDPDALPDFFEIGPSVDVVIGRRNYVRNVPFYRKLISRMASVVVNYALTDSFLKFRGVAIADCTSGFRRYSFRAAEAIAWSELKSKAFDFHMEALALTIRKGMKVLEIPITYVFSNSSFNKKVLGQAMKFGFYLLKTKGKT